MADYYVIHGNVSGQGQFEIVELDRLTTHFHMNSHNHKGTLCIHNLPGFHVTYDINVGTASLQSVQTHRGITESYSPSITQALTGIILIAIALYAKFHLLKKINELSNQDYPGVDHLKDIIKQCGVNARANTHISTKDVAKSFQGICAYIKTNKAVFSNFSIQGIENIQSVNDANISIQSLKTFLTAENSAQSHAIQKKF